MIVTKSYELIHWPQYFNVFYMSYVLQYNISQLFLSFNICNLLGTETLRFLEFGENRRYITNTFNTDAVSEPISLSLGFPSGLDTHTSAYVWV